MKAADAREEALRIKKKEAQNNKESKDAKRVVKKDAQKKDIEIKDATEVIVKENMTKIDKKKI